MLVKKNQTLLAASIGLLAEAVALALFIAMIGVWFVLFTTGGV